jgi:hypothetical protein
MAKGNTDSVEIDCIQVVGEIRKHGFALVPDVYSAEQCREFCSILETAVTERIEKGLYFGSSRAQVIYNYFLQDKRLYDLFAHPLMEAVISQLIDKDFVLISPSARNPCLRNDIPEGKKTSGDGWHVDSRIACADTGELFKPSMSYYSVVSLEPFTINNSATHYVPGSHLRYQRPANRDGGYESKVWEAPAGSVIFFDSALWHRAGSPTETSRWSIFNMYGPWFMKPYFQFRENYTLAEMQELPRNVQRMLHLMSTPPHDDSQRTSTVTQEPAYA